MAIYWRQNSSLTTMAHRTAWLVLSLTIMACTQTANKSIANIDGVPVLKPKATISLEYPNPWDINSQIALSNDGSRLIDATPGAPYIRVWDWQNNKVIQQLLLNEKISEGYDKINPYSVLGTSPGQELAFSPNGQLVAACIHSLKGSTRVWNWNGGAIVADIPHFQRYIPNQDQEKIFSFGNCNSISFSPDDKYMAILFDGSLHNNEVDYNTFSENAKNINYDAFNKGLYYKKRMSPEEFRAQKYYPTGITGIALFETSTWKLERLFYRPAYKQPTFKSRPLFDADSKIVSAVIFDQAPVGIWNTWVGNRIVRWDIATGAQLEEKDMPQLVNGENGLWWTSLPGSREVWWQVNNNSTSVVKESRPCKQSPPPSPTFFSDEKFNCDYAWLLATLNLDTAKIRYLAPYKNNASFESNEKTYEWAGISPDGAHIILLRRKNEGRKRFSTIEVLDRETLRLEGSYSADIGVFAPIVFSSDSRYLSFSFYKPSFLRSSYGREFAMVFELPKKQ